jgi:hypothetical protein
MLLVGAGDPGGILGSAHVIQTVLRTDAGWRIRECRIAET